MAALFLASDEARWITGVVLPVDAGLMTMAPQAVLNFLNDSLRRATMLVALRKSL
ncbi:MAG: hypothetical protein R2867_08905 [Caldilineaceae bacterium]